MIAEDFDAKAFAATMRQADVSSVTVFARCHHGWLYYPSRAFPELIHPHLRNRNLMLEQVRALHAEGIRAPIYVTIQWDYHSARTHPEWLIRKPGGMHEGGPFSEAGFYQSLCVNTPYFDFIEAHTREICEMLGDELDGFFFDIVGIRPCVCASCRAEMKARGMDFGDALAVREFATLVMNRFKERLTAIVREYSDSCTIFYNAGHVGPCTRDSRDAYTHLELESLPSGGEWGYLHFPASVRYARTLGVDLMGMTGKFHTEWGDFHSLKNQAALEFECFRMLSHGCAVSIGDQLEPRGVLNPATYELIGRVFRQVREREAWARPAHALTEAALVTSESKLFEHQIPACVMGAVQMLEELAIQFDVIDTQDTLERYALLILADDLTVTAEFQQKLDAYVQSGGKVIACARGGLNERNEYPSCFGTRYLGKEPLWPSFILPSGDMANGLVENNGYVIYEQGEAIEPVQASVLLKKHEPYFCRTGEHFCSHRYTPSARKEGHPSAVRCGGVILFSHPLFTQYRLNAPFWCKQLIGNAIDQLLPARMVRHSGPSTMTVSLLHQPQENRVCAHVLSYVPVRKSINIDLIEERTTLYNVQLKVNLPFGVKAARLVPEGVELAICDGCVTIPKVDGYAIIAFELA
ncbi:MAG: alpha-amylase family protein [Aristaeellaceae bacterium]